MADVAKTTTYTDAATAISQGKRHLLVQDYTAAVTAFAEGLEMMSAKLGDCDDELGEPYLLYGRALLGLAREEGSVLGGGVPGTEDDEEIDEEDVDDEGEDEKASDGDDKEESMDVAESSEKKEGETAEKTETEKDNVKEDKDKASSEEKPGAASNKTDDKKIEEKKLEASPEKSAKTSESNAESAPGSSNSRTNGTASVTDKNCNGATKSEESEADDDDVNKEDDEEDAGSGTDLQVAWEVLELAKLVFVKRGETGMKNLAETHRLLGEVALESGNPQGAITDFESALKFLHKIEPFEPRAIAELHYHLGLAHSLLNDVDASIENFREATNLLNTRLKQLEDLKEPPAKSDDPFYSVEGEIKELKELLPAIQEKITDMKDFNEQARKYIVEDIKSKIAAGGCTNGAGTSSDGASTSTQSSAAPASAKPASDISHLVRKKRKADESETPTASPCKKPTP